MNAAEILPFNLDDDDRPILLPEGEYEVVLDSYWKGILFGKSAKLILVFKIISPGPFMGKQLCRYYGIKGLTKRKEMIPKGWHSDLVREYSRLFSVPRKLRDIRIASFKNKVFVCTVRTVTKDYKQRPLPKELHYSVIDRLIKVA